MNESKQVVSVIVKPSDMIFLIVDEIISVEVRLIIATLRISTRLKIFKYFFTAVIILSYAFYAVCNSTEKSRSGIKY